MSKFKLGVSGSRSSARRPALQEEQSSRSTTSQFQPDATYGDSDETAQIRPGSLAGMSPAARGHTMKECEEQLSQLHKENFNLKLRIYFLEERLGHRGQAAPGTDAGTWEATLQAEAEALRIELAEKQQLLCHAATAIDLVEKKHREEVENLKAEARAERLALEERLTQLQKTSNERCKELEDEVSCIFHHSEQQREELASLTTQCQQQTEELGRRGKLVHVSTQCSEPSEQPKRCCKLVSVSTQCSEPTVQAKHCDKLVSVATQCAEPAVDLASAAMKERDEKIQGLAQELQLKGQQVAEAEQRIKGLEEALCEKQPEIQIKVQELRERENIIEEKQNQIEQQNRILVEIQITLAEKQRLIDALNSTISARDAKVSQLEAQLVTAQAAIRAGEMRLQEESHELSRVKGENEMLKTQLKRMNRSKDERESPRRRSHNLHARDMSPRNKSLIEEGIEGIWSAPALRARDEFLPLEEKENLWRSNESKEKTDKSQQFVDHENKLEKKSDIRINEENYLKLEKEHQRGCEAIQGFIARIKLLANENDHLKRDSKRGEKKLSELKLELKEMRDSYNRAKWEARQLQAAAMGVPGTAGTLADVKDMTEEENERLWAEIENKNKKLSQLSLEMERQDQALTTSLKQKEAQLHLCEVKLATSVDDLKDREKRIRELEEKVYELQSQAIRSLSDSQVFRNDATNNSKSFDAQNGSPVNIIIDDLEVGLKQSRLNLHNIFDTKLCNKIAIDNLQECLNIIFKKREMEIFSLQHQVDFKDLQLKMFANKLTELGMNTTTMSVSNECVPIKFTQHLHLQADEGKDQSWLSDLTGKGVLLTFEKQLSTSVAEQNNLRREVESLRNQLRNTPERDGDSRDSTTLRLECNRLKEDLCASEVGKKNATNVCSLLVGRLEELAGFLVSLLRHPERLGNLEVNHCQFIKQAVQRSVNLSRQLSMSITQHEENDCSGQVNNFMMQEPISSINFSLVSQYLDEVNETSGRLNDLPFASCSTETLDKLCGLNTNEAESTQETNATLEDLQSTSNVGDEQAQVIARLRSQVETLQLEIKQRDIELHCLMQEHNLIKMSSPLFDLKNNPNEHPLSSMTFYNKYHTANNVLGQAGKLNSCKSLDAKELTVALEIYGDIDDFHENSTDHIQLPEQGHASRNLFTHPQVASTNPSISKHARGTLSANTTALNTQHDALALSESETWSEPDRKISLARIGLPEESAGLGLPNTTSLRHHHSRTLQELDESSESSQETAREISRTPGKRRGDALELRRLQARLRGLEQVNEALRAELTILHQITPVSHSSPCPESPTGIDVNEQDTSDKLLNKNIVHTDEKSPPANLEKLDNPIVIPSHLLEQIKHQREKLESSLFHNDFIRHQLEEVFLSATNAATGVKLDEGKALRRIDDANEHIQETQNKIYVIEAKNQAAEDKATNLEVKLQEAEHLLAESREQATRVAQAEERCSDTHQTVSALQDKVNDLELQLREKDAEVIAKEGLLTEFKRKVFEQNTEINRIIQEMSKSERKLIQAEEREQELKKNLLNKVEEIERDIMLSEKKRESTEQELKAAKNNLNEAVMQKEEANKIIEMMKIEFCTKMHVCDETRKSLELEIEKRNIESNIEMERRSKKLEEAEKQLEELRWVYKAQVERKVKDAEKLGNDIEAGLRRQIEVAEKKTKDIEEASKVREADLRKKVQESEKRFLDQVVALRQQQDEAMLAASQAALERTRLANEKLRLEQELREHETKESELAHELREAEGRQLAIQEQLDDQILTLLRQKSELEQRVQDLEAANADLKFHLERLSLLKDTSYHTPMSSRRATSPPSHGHLRPEPCMFPRDSNYLSGRSWSSEGRTRSPDSSRSPLSNLVLQRGFGRQHSDFSDYVSEDQEYETIVTQSCSSYWITTVTGSRSEACTTPTGDTPIGRNINSPDLGIESDQGRFSSLEANVGPIASDHGFVERCSATELNDPLSAVQKFRGGRSDHNCTKITEENVELKRELCQTRRALEETLAQLTASNQRKQNVEKAICKQLEKTHNILMKTKGNLQPEHLMLCDDQN